MDVEHPLSDRAIAETAGQVLLFEGRLVDALYSSTCGGHTEDGHVIFPLKQEPYLKAVPCMEAGVATPARRPARGGAVPRQPDPPAAAALGERRRRWRSPPGSSTWRCSPGCRCPRTGSASLDRREVHRFLASVFDLALDARLFVASGDVPYLLDEPARGLEPRRTAAAPPTW